MTGMGREYNDYAILIIDICYINNRYLQDGLCNEHSRLHLLIKQEVPIYIASAYGTEFNLKIIR